jgi:hypothetical protein
VHRCVARAVEHPDGGAPRRVLVLPPRPRDSHCPAYFQHAYRASLLSARVLRRRQRARGRGLEELLGERRAFDLES